MKPTPYQKQIEYVKLVGVALVILQISMLIDFVQQGNQLSTLLGTFIGICLLVFGTVKVMAFNEFVDSFTKYDILAAKFKPYAQLYPLIEVGLGAILLTNPMNTQLQLFILLLEGISLLGSVRVSLGNKKLETINTGSIIKLPLSTITFSENIIVFLSMLVAMLF